MNNYHFATYVDYGPIIRAKVQYGIALQALHAGMLEQLFVDQFEDDLERALDSMGLDEYERARVFGSIANTVDVLVN